LTQKREDKGKIWEKVMTLGQVDTAGRGSVILFGAGLIGEGSGGSVLERDLNRDRTRGGGLQWGEIVQMRGKLRWQGKEPRNPAWGTFSGKQLREGGEGNCLKKEVLRPEKRGGGKKQMWRGEKKESPSQKKKKGQDRKKKINKKNGERKREGGAVKKRGCCLEKKRKKQQPSRGGTNEKEKRVQGRPEKSFKRRRGGPKGEKCPGVGGGGPKKKRKKS